MRPERWQKVEQVYNAALEHKPDQREAFLEAACAGDDSLRMEVESLLAGQSEAKGFIESPALEAAAQDLARANRARPRQPWPAALSLTTGFSR